MILFRGACALSTRRIDAPLFVWATNSSENNPSSSNVSKHELFFYWNENKSNSFQSSLRPARPTQAPRSSDRLVLARHPAIFSANRRTLSFARRGSLRLIHGRVTTTCPTTPSQICRRFAFRPTAPSSFRVGARTRDWKKKRTRMRRRKRR